MLLYNGGVAKRVAQDVILDRILIKNTDNLIVSQFYIRSSDDILTRFTDVIFLEGFFNVSSIEVDRIVLGIWANNKVTYHICLIFAGIAEASDFYESILQYAQPAIKIDEERIEVLFSADLNEIKTIAE